MFAGTEREVVIQETVRSRTGVDRTLKFAFELAQKRAVLHLTSATKSNGISITMPFWDGRLAEIKRHYPDLTVDQFHIDILCAHFVQRPQFFDVVVASSPLRRHPFRPWPRLYRRHRHRPSGNINPERGFPSLFEPVHGSANDIAGKVIANPIGQIWAGAMMLDDLGHPEAAAAIVSAIEAVLVHPHLRTRDMGGTADTVTCSRAVAEALLCQTLERQSIEISEDCVAVQRMTSRSGYP